MWMRGVFGGVGGERPALIFVIETLGAASIITVHLQRTISNCIVRNMVDICVETLEGVNGVRGSRAI